MVHSEVISKAKVLIESLPYIQRFKGSIFVVKYGGSFLDDSHSVFHASVATDIVFLAAVGIHVVVVHGGGKAISRALKVANIASSFIHGLRVTDDMSIPIIERVLNMEINTQIVDTIREQDGDAKSLQGNSILTCEKYFPRDAIGELMDLGFVGNITFVETDSIREILAKNQIPVISPIALDKNKQTYNTNADEAAAKIAIALNARRLVYLCDVPGLLENPQDPKSIFSTLHLSEVNRLIQKGIISEGMLPKVNSAVTAIQRGVRRVHFIDGQLPHSILLEIFTDSGIGTQVIHD